MPAVRLLGNDTFSELVGVLPDETAAFVNPSCVAYALFDTTLVGALCALPEANWESTVNALPDVPEGTATAMLAWPLLFVVAVTGLVLVQAVDPLIVAPAELDPNQKFTVCPDDDTLLPKASSNCAVYVAVVPDSTFVIGAKSTVVAGPTKKLYDTV